MSPSFTTPMNNNTMFDVILINGQTERMTRGQLQSELANPNNIISSYTVSKPAVPKPPVGQAGIDGGKK